MLMILSVFPVFGEQKVELDITLSNPVLMDEGQQTNFVRIGLTGFEGETEGERPAVNAAIVLDVSGSMSGEKIRQAVDAAHTAIEMLRNGDIVSIITYSDYTQVVVPAQPLTQFNRRQYHLALDQIYASGSTALFAGVSMGGRELERYLSDNMVNRVILLSDGLANVGPSTPGELGNLGEILRRRNISVSTIGLGSGYNDALMFELAARSDGNHAFVESPRDLVWIFQREFETLMAVVAQDLEIHITCGPGIRPMRLINRQGEIYGNEVVISMNQLYSMQEQYIILEVEVDPGEAGEERQAADVSVDYTNMYTRHQDSLEGGVTVGFTRSERAVIDNRDDDTTADVVFQTATETNAQAVQLREEGRVEEAEELLRDNAGYLSEYGEELQDERLNEYALQNSMDADDLYTEDWETQRKAMRDEQYENQTQQVY
jgi:Ca-activated chloride channel family protein